MPLLSSYNCFACLEVDTLIEPHICVANSTEVMQTHSHPPIPNQHSCHHTSWEAEPDLGVQLAVQSQPRDQLADKGCQDVSLPVRGTPLLLSSYFFYILSIPTHSLSTGSISIDCDRYGHSHVM
jgi:hypothetical protein